MTSQNTATTLLRTAVRAEHLLLRTPLSIAADAAASRFGDRSRVSVTLERGVEALDAVAARLLSASEPSGAGRERQPRPEPQSPTAARPGVPDPAEAAAAFDAGTTPAETAGPDQPLPAKEQEVVEHVAEELLDEQEHKPLAGELGDDDELRRIQAELQAKHLVEEQAELQD